MFYQLAPVGNPVSLQPSSATAASAFFAEQGWQSRFYDSGTAALAACMLAAARYTEKPTGEVILPAYGCPDLVAAVEYSQLTPVLVDLQAEHTGYDLDKLAAAINEKTVAIVAVDLFGIGERISAMRELLAAQAGSRPVVLIEDSAQGFPSRQQINRGEHWQGDLVVLSFGRGKPLSLLGGGAVLVRQNTLGAHLPEAALAENPVDDSGHISLLQRIKTQLYNAMIHPRLYWLPQSLPFLHLGETRYHPLLEMQAMPVWRQSILASNLVKYHALDQHVADLTAAYRKVFAGQSAVVDLSELTTVEAGSRLLRYPVLLPADRRQACFEALAAAGLGASLMYPKAMPEIADVPQSVCNTYTAADFPCATDFASRIMTLPLHHHVTLKQVQQIGKIMQSAGGMRGRSGIM